MKPCEKTCCIFWMCCKKPHDQKEVKNSKFMQRWGLYSYLTVPELADRASPRFVVSGLENEKPIILPPRPTTGMGLKVLCRILFVSKLATLLLLAPVQTRYREAVVAVGEAAAS